MLTLAIIADDLTGALDAAAPFAPLGAITAATQWHDIDKALKDNRFIVSISTRSREIPEDQAFARVQQVLAGLPAGTRVFKKVDSRLKGNLQAELDAWPDAPLLVAPAIPEFGRIVTQGHLSGFGVAAPICIRTALGRHATRAIIPDTPDAASMRQAVRLAPNDAIFVGARGLAQALAAEMGAIAVQPPGLPTPICFAIGSVDPITRSQIDALIAANPDLQVFDAPSGELPQIATAPATVSLVRLTEGPPITPLAAALRFAETSAPQAAKARTIVVSGGATAEAMLDALGYSVLSVAGEILPGLPICTAGAHTIITKSGGFGTPDTFVNLAKSTALRKG